MTIFIKTVDHINHIIRLLLNIVSIINVKPIFNQNAKYLVSGAGVGQFPRRQNFELGIPTWYLKCENLRYPTPNPDAKSKLCVSPNAKPRCQSVEYRLRWVPMQNAGVGHVYFMFFVYILFAFGTHHEPNFRWNMGFRIYVIPLNFY